MADSAQEDHAEKADGTEHEPAADAEPQPAAGAAGDAAGAHEPAAEPATVAAAEAEGHDGDSSHADEAAALLPDVQTADEGLPGAATEAAQKAEPAAAEAAAVAELASEPAAVAEPAAEPVAAAKPASEPPAAGAEPAAEPVAEAEPASEATAAEQAEPAALQQQAPAPKPSSAVPQAAEAPAGASAADSVATKPAAAAAAGALESPREPQHGKPHKETAAERLTTPTAMRMLHSLEATHGNKTEFHIASGVVYKGKKLAADELSAMVDRLAVPKHAGDAALPPKPHAVKLVYEENKEQLVPVKEVTKEENIAFMAQLYSRCQETHAKTQQTLADKYLGPLVKPKAASPKK